MFGTTIHVVLFIVVYKFVHIEQVFIDTWWLRSWKTKLPLHMSALYYGALLFVSNCTNHHNFIPSPHLKQSQTNPCTVLLVLSFHWYFRILYKIHFHFSNPTGFASYLCSLAHLHSFNIAYRNHVILAIISLFFMSNTILYNQVLGHCIWCSNTNKVSKKFSNLMDFFVDITPCCVPSFHSQWSTPLLSLFPLWVLALRLLPWTSCISIH